MGAGEGAGKSGSFFFFTKDSKFIIKTIPNQDKDSLVRCLEGYINYLSLNPNSLLARHYGLFKVMTPFFKPCYIVLMGNVTKFNQKENCLYTFDLKGSKYTRNTKGFKPAKAFQFHRDLSNHEKTGEVSKSINQSQAWNKIYVSLSDNLKKQKLPLYKPVLKDLDFKAINNVLKDKNVFSLSEKQQTKIIQILAKDVDFLRSNWLLDYSFFVAVEYFDGQGKLDVSRHSYLSSSGNEIYHFGIIDFL